MEEQVGQLWHRLITRAARRGYPEAAVTLDEVRRPVGVLFRALGGDRGLRVEAATATLHRARRSWLARIAGTDTHTELAWRDGETLRLPERLACYPTPELNRAHYLWLAALAAVEEDEGGWFQASQQRVRATLDRWPGLGARYRALVAAELAQRPDAARLPMEERAAELALRAALQDPGSVASLPSARRPPRPLPLWLHPTPPGLSGHMPADTPDPEPEVDSQEASAKEQRRKRGERVAMPDGKSGLLAFRLESLFTWAEYVPVDRTTEEDEDKDSAGRAADDLDVLSVARDRSAAATRLRFDLDLPAAENDDLVLGEGIPLPEWDFRRQSLRPDYCRVVPMMARDAAPQPLPAHLNRPARRLRAQFQALAPARAWQRGLEEGSEVDLDAYLQHAAERAAGEAVAARGLYRDLRSGSRDLACLLLADLSLSTDAWVNDEARVIDVIRDSLFLFTEALAATGDRFALYGFSSRRRNHVRFHQIKAFDERPNAAVRGRIQAIRPGYYTRMGAAIRHASGVLEQQGAGRRLLLLLTDGKPNDLDLYEGRYGAEDTRQAILEARRRGLQPFCVTIDREAGDYLPHLFGNGGFGVIRHPAELPGRLPQLYARLTR